MPKLINTPTPGQALVRMFSLKGRFQPVLDETIVPVVIVPLDAPASKRLAWGGTTAGASGGGNQNVVTFGNPPQSGVLIVITKLIAISGTPLTDHVHPTFGTTTATGSNTGVWRDLRLSNAPLARLVTFALASAVLIPPQYFAANTVSDVEIVLPPGWELTLKQSEVNTTLEMTFEWYEMPLRGDSEL